MWTLDIALELIRLIQPKLKSLGYHVCLGGGVLNTGKSAKDLDLYFLPFGPNQSHAKLVEYLESIWDTGKSFANDGARVEVENATGGLTMAMPATSKPDYPSESHFVYAKKHCYSDLRIDVFVVGVGQDQRKDEFYPKAYSGQAFNKQVGEAHYAGLGLARGNPVWSEMIAEGLYTTQSPKWPVTWGPETTTTTPLITPTTQTEGDHKNG